MLDPREWGERETEHGSDGGIDSALLTTEERELQGVKRAEEEERHGTKGRELGGMGGGEKGGSGSSVGVAMKMKNPGDKEALRALRGEGMVVQYVSLNFCFSLVAAALFLLNYC